MKIWSRSFSDGDAIPEIHAFGVYDPEEHMRLGPNRNPHIAWSDLPQDTRSLALICVDPDAPSRADDVNQEGKVVSADLPRTDFYHWVMVDIAPALGEIAEGSCSDGVTAGGKNLPRGPKGTRQGINGYTGFLAGDPDLEGKYLGYDGPCPPWNDEIPHRYRFCLYALDLEKCPVQGEFEGTDVLEAIDGHVLAEARFTGVYSLNPKTRAG